MRDLVPTVETIREDRLHIRHRAALSPHFSVTMLNDREEKRLMYFVSTQAVGIVVCWTCRPRRHVLYFSKLPPFRYSWFSVIKASAPLLKWCAG